MTLEILGTYRGLLAERDSIKDELKHVYETVKSPRLDGEGSMRPDESKTERAAMRAVELTSRLDELNEKLTDALIEIEEYIQTVEDPQIRASLRHHFICGKTWRETSRIVYGKRASKETARAACARMLSTAREG